MPKATATLAASLMLAVSLSLGATSAATIGDVRAPTLAVIKFRESPPTSGGSNSSDPRGGDVDRELSDANKEPLPEPSVDDPPAASPGPETELSEPAPEAVDPPERGDDPADESTGSTTSTDQAPGHSSGEDQSPPSHRSSLSLEAGSGAAHASDAHVTETTTTEKP